MALRSIPVGWCVEQVPSHLLQTFTHRDVKVKYFHHTIFFQQDVHCLPKGFQTECLCYLCTSANLKKCEDLTWMTRSVVQGTLRRPIEAVPRDLGHGAELSDFLAEIAPIISNHFFSNLLNLLGRVRSCCG